MKINPDTDLELVRHLKAPPAKVWRCWTEAALLEQWFAPKPVATRDVSIDLRRGGSFRYTMDIPDHGSMSGHGCILDLIPERLLVSTDLLEGDWRPAGESFGFTSYVFMEPEGTGTLYRAVALHLTPEKRVAHEQMGFHEGWGTAAAQLDALAVTL